jgi:hypothetical protein
MENANVISAAAALSAVLSASEAKIGSLIESAKLKEALLRAEDIEGLKAAVEQEEELVASFGAVDVLREEKSKALARAVGLKEESPALGDIIAAMGDTPQAVSLSALREKLKAALARLDMHNTRVAHLLELKKQYADFMLESLREPEPRAAVYSQTGERAEGDSGRRILDVQI